MKISSAPTWERPRSLPSQPVLSKSALSQVGEEIEDPQDGEWGEKIMRWIGSGAQGVSMAPKFLESRPWILEKLNLEAGPWIQTGAAAFGGVATLALATAGSMELSDGIQHKNRAEGLSGLSELSRAGYVGTWTASLLTGDAWTQGLGSVSQGLGVLSGGLQVAAGLARMTHKKRPDNPVNPKVVGLLEAGMGAAWSGSMLGAPVGLCWALRTGLTVAKTLYTNREKWQTWTDWEGRG